MAEPPAFGSWVAIVRLRLSMTRSQECSDAPKHLGSTSAPCGRAGNLGEEGKDPAPHLRRALEASLALYAVAWLMHALV
jgi:hypothetical protein